MFKKAYFIKPQEVFHREFGEANPSVIYHTAFTLDSVPRSASLLICALGLGYAYINGKRVSDDIFPSPPSDYEKRLWCMKYDITHLLCEGENSISVWCGNGFLNEDMQNGWSSTEAHWRDFPKLIAEITTDSEVTVSTSDSWKYTLCTPYTMNRYRMGVDYDMRIAAPDSKKFSTEGWQSAKIDERAPAGIPTLYTAEPIRECEMIEPVSITKNASGSVLYDFGITMSGYARVTLEGNPGDLVTVRYAETVDEHGSVYTDRINSNSYYPEGDFATERIICSGDRSEWSTLFSYYGFRYVEIIANNPDACIDIKAVFVRQDIKRRSGFECSDKFLNRLYECAIRATQSNTFYMPTDCPTREKYGWLNDAQSSSEQILMNFHAEDMLLNWNVNICDALDDKKGLPGIVPTHGWGYTWGNGPVSDGSLFEHVYRVYLHTGNADGLIYNLPYFRRYFAFIKTREDDDGGVRFGLYDWANPTRNKTAVPLEFINSVYRVKFARIAALAARLAGEDESEFLAEEREQTEFVKKSFIHPDGTCSVKEQTALAMLIYHRIYDDPKPLVEQLVEYIKEKEYHHNCGMVGLRHLYMALNSMGLQEYAMRIVKVKGFPSYSEWIDNGATTLWEMWDSTLSHNHHMYSDVVSWIFKTVGGISPDDNAPSFENIEVDPYYFDGIDYCRSFYDSPMGRVEVNWTKSTDGVNLSIISPTDGYVVYKGNRLPSGKSEFIIPEQEIN